MNKPNTHKHVDTGHSTVMGEGKTGKGGSTAWQQMETTYLVVKMPLGTKKEKYNAVHVKLV